MGNIYVEYIYMVYIRCTYVCGCDIWVILRIITMIVELHVASISLVGCEDDGFRLKDCSTNNSDEDNYIYQQS